MKAWHAILIFFLVAVATRLFVNFRTELVPGLNGAYYLIQTRSLIETGTLAFADFPLTFYLEAGGALSINFFTQDLDSSIVIAHKLTDSLIPPLAIFPSWYLVRKIFKRYETHPWTTAVIAGLSILSISPLMFFIGDFTKNSLGNLAVLTFLCTLIGNKTGSYARRLALSACAFLLAATTHISALVLAVSFGLVYVTQIILQKKRFKQILLLLLMVGFGLIVLSFLIKLIDRARYERILYVASAPTRLFNNPVLRLVIAREHAIRLTNVTVIVFFSLVGAAGSVYEYRQLRASDKPQEPFFLYLAVLTFFLSSPFLGYAWAERFWQLAFIPGVVVLARMASNQKQLNWKITIPLTAYLGASLAVALLLYKEPLLLPRAVTEMQVIKNLLPTEHAAYMLPHGYTYWWAWFTHQEFVAAHIEETNTLRDTYDVVYAIVPRDDQEIIIPKNAPAIFSGEEFTLYQMYRK